MSEVSQSPLTEVAKESLAELFARDPMALSAQDIQTICTTLRAQRERWQREDSDKQKGVKRAKVQLSQSEMDDILNSI